MRPFLRSLSLVDSPPPKAKYQRAFPYDVHAATRVFTHGCRHALRPGSRHNACLFFVSERFAIVPMIGKGTYADQSRPMFVPAGSFDQNRVTMADTLSRRCSQTCLGEEQGRSLSLGSPAGCSSFKFCRRADDLKEFNADAVQPR